MTNAEIEEAMETLPDIVGDALYNFKAATIDKERLCAKTFLEIKARSAGEKITVAEIEAMVKADVDTWDEMKFDAIQKCIDFLKKKIAPMEAK